MRFSAAWSHHRREGGWSGWVRDVRSDDDLADAIDTIAAQNLDPPAGRRAFHEEIAARYPALDAA